MSVNSIVSASGQSILSQLQSATSKSTDTDKIKQEITKSGQNYTAQQIADKYDISEAQAEKILKEIEEAKQEAKQPVKEKTKEETKTPDKDSDAVKTSIASQTSSTDATGATNSTDDTDSTDTSSAVSSVSNVAQLEEGFTASDASTVSYIV